jgi:hypothetical protein
MYRVVAEQMFVKGVIYNSPYADECQWRGQVNLSESYSNNEGLRTGASRALR